MADSKDNKHYKYRQEIQQVSVSPGCPYLPIKFISSPCPPICIKRYVHKGKCLCLLSSPRNDITRYAGRTSRSKAACARGTSSQGRTRNYAVMIGIDTLPTMFD